jgi:AAA domain-containing protein/UvrD-like helicase family protein
VNPTDEQQIAIDATRTTSESIVLDAMAGTGKTTTLTMLARELKSGGLALAFNKSIALELAKRFPPAFDVKTMNALGFSAIRRAIPSVVSWKIEPKKLGTIVTQVAKDSNVKLVGDQWAQVRDVVIGAQLAGIVPANGSGTPIGLTPDTPDSWADIASAKWVDSTDVDVVCDVARDVLIESNRQVLKGVISFDDQVYWPAAHHAAFAWYGAIVVDEAQDLNMLQHVTVAASLRADGRLVVCGDPRQSIYAFRGSVRDSMERLTRLREAMRRLGLTLTFRCPKVVVALQQGHAPGYRAADGNAEGRHIVIGDRDWTWDDIVMAKPHTMSTIAILCRNNAPVFAMAFKLLRQGVGVNVMGSDIGRGLTELTRKLAKDDATPVAKLIDALARWQADESRVASLNGHDEKISAIADRAESVMAIIEGSQARTAGEVRSAITKLFAQMDSRVTLSTAHRAKGLEWDVVVHLDPHRVPSKWARHAALKGDHEALRQEANLRYVLETRTRHVLIEAPLEGFGRSA